MNHPFGDITGSPTILLHSTHVPHSADADVAKINENSPAGISRRIIVSLLGELQKSPEPVIGCRDDDADRVSQIRGRRGMVFYGDFKLDTGRGRTRWSMHVGKVELHCSSREDGASGIGDRCRPYLDDPVPS